MLAGTLRKRIEQDTGSAPFFIGAATGFARVEDKIKVDLECCGMKYTCGILQGECSKANIKKLQEVLERKYCDCVVGIGGGKVIDTAKAVSYYCEKPLIIAPTSASNDAPCSALSVLYDENGVFDQYLFLKSNPDMVLVDTEIIANAPARLTIAGMGDALATYYEARAVQRSGKNNQVHAKPTAAAFALAKTCRDILMTDGITDKIDMEAGHVTEAVENVIEANIYLSDVGFESGGLAAVHGIQKGITLIPQTREALHGEIVACCLISMLILEKAPEYVLIRMSNEKQKPFRFLKGGRSTL